MTGIAVKAEANNNAHMAKDGSLSFNTKTGRMCETLREPVNVLKSLSEKASNKQYKFQRLYRNLYNPEFYLLAYKNISQSQGSMTAGVDGKSLDGMSERRINALIESLKDFSYQPNPARRVYIDKKNSTKKRPLGIPATEDKLVQEIVKMILESIYEPMFSKSSHGFRPNRSCHTALQQIQNQFTGVTWFVEGDIHACFDSFDHHIMVEILRERIEDENFLALIWKMLKAGYMEQWHYHCSYSGTPQGSGASPVLANIYLSKMDEFAEQLKDSFDKGDSLYSLEYQRAASKLYYIRRRNRRYWTEWGEQERKEALKLQKEAQANMHSVPSKKACNQNYKRLFYCRYADDFLIGVIGSHEDAEKIKEEFHIFLKTTLHLEMSDSKTKITHGQDKARFLGYDITTAKKPALMYDSKNQLRKTETGTIKLYAPKDKWQGKLLEYGALGIRYDANGKEIWDSHHRGNMIHMTDVEIVSQVNAEIRGMYNYYSITNNATIIKNFAFILEYSMYKTFGLKYHKSVYKVQRKYRHNGIFMVPYSTKAGLKYCEFYHGGFKRKKSACRYDPDLLPAYVKYDNPNYLRTRIKNGVCELCGSRTEDIRMHHIKSLKSIKADSEWNKLMLAKRRKTLAVCPDCYATITNS